MIFDIIRLGKTGIYVPDTGENFLVHGLVISSGDWREFRFKEYM